LYCVGETLVALSKIGIMHRDIRWANVFHALDDENNNGEQQQQQTPSFTREWILFDFEYAAFSPQNAFPAHTLTPGNHAPEMILHGNNDTTTAVGQEQKHDTAVDIWGFGYLIQHSMVNIPESHFDDIKQLQDDCIETNPTDRPTAIECLERICILQARPQSKEKDLH
jgi:serine/threonine protein kinase